MANTNLYLFLSVYQHLVTLRTTTYAAGQMLEEVSISLIGLSDMAKPLPTLLDLVLITQRALMMVIV